MLNNIKEIDDKIAELEAIKEQLQKRPKFVPGEWVTDASKKGKYGEKILYRYCDTVVGRSFNFNGFTIENPLRLNPWIPWGKPEKPDLDDETWVVWECEKRYLGIDRVSNIAWDHVNINRFFPVEV
jgi:hypothetical protein